MQFKSPASPTVSSVFPVTSPGHLQVPGGLWTAFGCPGQTLAPGPTLWGTALGHEQPEFHGSVQRCLKGHTPTSGRPGPRGHGGVLQGQ